MTEKNKGGRPTNAELASRGITKSELELGLRLLKKHFGPAVTRAIEIANTEGIPLDKQFKMQIDLIKLFMEMKRADIQLKNSPGNDGEGQNGEPVEGKPIFKLV